MPGAFPELEVLFIDMDAFYALVEQMDRPETSGPACQSHGPCRPIGLLQCHQHKHGGTGEDMEPCAGRLAAMHSHWIVPFVSWKRLFRVGDHRERPLECDRSQGPQPIQFLGSSMTVLDRQIAGPSRAGYLQGHHGGHLADRRVL